MSKQKGTRSENSNKKNNVTIMVERVNKYYITRGSASDLQYSGLKSFFIHDGFPLYGDGSVLQGENSLFEFLGERGVEYRNYMFSSFESMLRKEFCGKDFFEYREHSSLMGSKNFIIVLEITESPIGFFYHFRELSLIERIYKQIRKIISLI
jgi:hypothetical protein